MPVPALPQRMAPLFPPIRIDHVERPKGQCTVAICSEVPHSNLTASESNLSFASRNTTYEPELKRRPVLRAAVDTARSLFRLVDGPKQLHDLFGIVGRPIIDDDDFHRPIRLFCRALYCISKIAGMVVLWNDDRDEVAAG
jgi:hypothetical protein